MSTSLEDEPLPQVQDAILDAETLEQLASDLQSFATVDEVLLKGGAMAMTSGQSVSLAEAMDALKQGQVVGIQIRYRYGGSSWWDTLLRTPHGIRIVRIEQRLDAL